MLPRDASLALLTDLYQLTMAYGYWKHRRHEHEAVFHLTFRKCPFGGAFALACGLHSAIDYLTRWKFTPDDLAFLSTLTDSRGERLFEPAFLEFLGEARFACDVDAIPEGTAVFPHEPLVRVQGPLW
ncbi:MAG TPA: nicotinate phosphoribosyltransferase, partial [Pirellulales bacterium]